MTFKRRWGLCPPSPHTHGELTLNFVNVGCKMPSSSFSQSRCVSHGSRGKVFGMILSKQQSRETSLLPAWGARPHPPKAGGGRPLPEEDRCTDTLLGATLNLPSHSWGSQDCGLDTKGQASGAGTTGSNPLIEPPWRFGPCLRLPWHHTCVYVTVFHEAIKRFPLIYELEQVLRDLFTQLMADKQQRIIGIKNIRGSSVCREQKQPHLLWGWTAAPHS